MRSSSDKVIRESILEYKLEKKNVVAARAPCRFRYLYYSSYYFFFVCVGGGWGGRGKEWVSSSSSKKKSLSVPFVYTFVGVAAFLMKKRKKN